MPTKITISNPNKLFFTSDNHFYHHNIIKHCNRPFSSVHEMNIVMTERWNNTVSKDSTIIVVGDFLWRSKVVPPLNGKIIRLQGNHDKEKDFPDILEVSVVLPEGKQLIVCCHYPMMSWNKSFYGSWHVFGHVHNYGHVQAQNKKLHNVCVELNNYMPISFWSLKEIMDTRLPKHI